MTVYQIDPLRDPRWTEFLVRHPRASVFHTVGWFEAVRRTYGYEPLVLTTAAPREALTNGLAVCRIRSWLTGRRLVSIPFSDHCQPLVDSAATLKLLVGTLESGVEQGQWKYVELRPLISNGELEAETRLAKSESFYFHQLDLRPDLDQLFHGFHKSCVQRKIQRAERERLTYEEGRSESLLGKFHHLLLLTRRRHQLPPQPRVWFRNLIDCLGDKLSIRVVSKDGQPIASILTLFHKKSMVYKYGCSDARFHNLGGMAHLFWQTIQEGKRLGAQEFDLGRSEVDNNGLIRFKERWSAACSRLHYYRYPYAGRNSATTWKALMVRQACARLPDSFLTAAGELLYKHFG